MVSWCKPRRGLVWVTAGILAVGGVQWAWAQEAGDVGPSRIKGVRKNFNWPGKSS